MLPTINDAINNILTALNDELSGKDIPFFTEMVEISDYDYTFTIRCAKTGNVDYQVRLPIPENNGTITLDKEVFERKRDNHMMSNAVWFYSRVAVKYGSRKWTRVT